MEIVSKLKSRDRRSRIPSSSVVFVQVFSVWKNLSKIFTTHFEDASGSGSSFIFVMMDVMGWSAGEYSSIFCRTSA